MIKNKTRLHEILAPLISEAGSQLKFAKQFVDAEGNPMSQQSVSAWLRFGYMPAHHAIHLHKLYPDVAVRELVAPKFRHLIEVAGE